MRGAERSARALGFLMFGGALTSIMLSVSAVDAAFAEDGEPRSRGTSMRSAGEMRGEPVARSQERRRRRLRERLREALPEFSAVERRILLREVRKLPEAERATLREKVRKIEGLSASERSDLSAQLRGLLENASQDVDRMERNLDRWEGMSKRERETYRKQMRKLRSMSDEERRVLLGEWEARRKRKPRVPAQ